jgi:hypothetical protein
MLGNPVLIMSGSDETSVQLRQRLWVELQMIGIQSVFSTVPTRFPTAESLAELTLMVRRSHAKSVVCVGDAELLQTAAAARQVAGPRLPLLAVPTGVFPAAYYALSQQLKTPDADVITWQQTAPPDVSLAMLCHMCAMLYVLCYAMLCPILCPIL